MPSTALLDSTKNRFRASVSTEAARQKARQHEPKMVVSYVFCTRCVEEKVNLPPSEDGKPRETCAALIDENNGFDFLVLLVILGCDICFGDDKGEVDETLNTRFFCFRFKKPKV